MKDFGSRLHFPCCRTALSAIAVANLEIGEQWQLAFGPEYSLTEVRLSNQLDC
jgi:hypothetical protein